MSRGNLLLCLLDDVIREIIELCAMISERGITDEDGKRTILFGELFNAYR